MNKYQINPKGQNYILDPPRNRNGQIPTAYFVNVILIYMFKKGVYRPQEFKKYIESLNILITTDRELMSTRNYPIWKHHIDRTKQILLDKLQYIKEKELGIFVFSKQKITEAYNKVSAYIEAITEEKQEFQEAKEYPPERIKTTIARVIRDTELSKKIKEKRNYQCQVCGTILTIKDKKYIETHHLRPLGHEGPDSETNILILCPNHHVLFDNGEIAISTSDYKTILDSKGRVVSTLLPPIPKREYIEYHYQNIYKNNSS